MRRRAFVLCGSAIAWVCLAAGARAQVIRTDLDVTNGTVFATAVSGNTLYLGGQFSRVGPATGGGAVLDGTSGLKVPGSPLVTGQVYAVVSDGAGGWFIGGYFSAVGGVARSNLAHILSDNTLAPWNPSADQMVTALAVSGSTVYVGGYFSHAGGAARNNLAALDASSGVATAWDPSPDFSVAALAVSGSTLYVAGWFNNIGGQPRTRLAAVSASTGDALAWDPSPNANPLALAVSGGIVYVGGMFTQIGGQPRNYVAAFDAGTGLVTSWDPNANDIVSSLAVSGSTVYAGGWFNTIGGQTRPGLAALSATTAQASSWNPAPNSAIDALAVQGSVVYAGGLYDQIGGAHRENVAAIDASTGFATSWAADPDQGVTALASDGSRVYAGGSFTLVGGKVRNNLAAISLTSGSVTSWNPNVQNIVQGAVRPGAVRVLMPAGPVLYTGGKFSVIGDTTAGGAVRNNLAAISTSSGQPTGWDPDVRFGSVQELAGVGTLARDGATLYVGGLFNSVGGEIRNHVAAVDVGSGLPTPWNPSANDSVTALVFHGGVVFAGGRFTHIGGQNRSFLVALDAAATDSTNGIVTSWNGHPLLPVTALAANEFTVFAGGRFALGGGFTPLAALDALNGDISAWDPLLTGQVNAIAPDGSNIYVGGNFTQVGGGQRNSIASLDYATAALSIWNPNPYTNDVYSVAQVNSIVVAGSAAYVGGSFSRFGGLPLSSIAAMGDVSTPTLLSLVRASAEHDRVSVVWYAAEAPSDAITLERSDSGAGWRALRTVVPDGSGYVRIEDTDVVPGERYGYRLAVHSATSDATFGETWVEVPGDAEFALAGPRPNPAARDFTVSLALPDAAPARLELLDVGGRRILARDVGALGAGRHTVTLTPARDLAPGLYLLRLTRGSQTRVARAAIVR